MEQSFNEVKYYFFWNRFLSNWYPSPFEVSGVKYNCVEQYMMHQKAMIFDDHIAACKIKKTSLPKIQKLIGRGVNNFNSKFWDSVKYELVKMGVRAKFVQNKSLRKELIKLKGFQIVEASPEDRIWGIGYDKIDAMRNIDSWGENLLGKILTELAIELS